MKERQDAVKDQGREPLEREGRKGNLGRKCLCGKTCREFRQRPWS